MIPAPHSANRQIDWATAIILMLVGLAAPASPWLGLEPQPVLESLSSSYLSGGQVGVLLACIGLLRCWALYGNGRWREYGCMVRLVGASIGAVVWATLLGGAISVTISSKLFYLSIIFFSVFTVFEFYSLSIAIRDRHFYARARANAAIPS